MRVEGASISAAARIVGASGRVAAIAASSIALDEIWAYTGARIGEKRNDLCGSGRARQGQMDGL